MKLLAQKEAADWQTAQNRDRYVTVGLLTQDFLRLAGRGPSEGGSVHKGT